jgi:importin-4
LKKDYYTQPQSLVLLLQILVSDDSIEIKQLAATEARKLVGKHWAKIPDGQKPEIRERLLQSTMTESSKAVRHALSRLIGVIAQKDLSNNEWQDLPNLMLQGAESNNPQAREVSTYILFSILDEVNDDASAFNYSKMFEIFSKTLQDRENPEVPINTLFALSKMAIAIDTDGNDPALGAFQNMIPQMVTVLNDIIASGESDRINQAFECFQTILDAKPKILDSHFRQLIEQMATITADSSKDGDSRTQALNFLLSALLNRKMKFQSLRIGPELVNLLFTILSGEDTIEQVDDDEMDLTRSAMHMLTLMASEMPPQQVAAPVVKNFQEYASSPNPRKKQAAITALAQCVEGAPEFIGTQLPQLIPLILELLNDPRDKVREMTVLGCRDIAEALPEVLAMEHEKFLTGFAKNLAAAVSKIEGDDATKYESVAANCCLAIDGLVSGLSAKDVEPYMAELVPNLTRLFSHPTNDIKKSSISAVGSIAVVAQRGFLPYFDQVATSLSQFIELKEGEEELELRAIATDTMGDLADAVGPEAFKSFVPPLIRSSQEGLHLDHPRLRETSYMLWSALAKSYKEDFKTFLEPSVKSILDALAQEEDADFEVELNDDSDLLGQEVVIGGKKIRVVGDGMAEKDDDTDDDDDDNWADLAGISAIAEEKEVALEALADIYSHTGKEFLPYYPKTIESILPLLEHSHEATRRAAISAMFRLYASLWQLQPDSQSKWEPGMPVKNQPTPEIAHIRDELMKRVLEQYGSEDDRYVL